MKQGRDLRVWSPENEDRVLPVAYSLSRILLKNYTPSLA